jgi:hypothetical protein
MSAWSSAPPPLGPGDPPADAVGCGEVPAGDPDGDVALPPVQAAIKVLIARRLA